MAKKVIAIVSLVIVGLLVCTTLVMANVKVNYGVNCASPEIIRVLKPNAKDADTVSEQAQKDIKNYIANASKESSLTALFNGALFDHASVISHKTTPTTIQTKSDCYYIQYVYSTPQTLKEGRGNYKENGKNYLYKELWFEISDAEGVEDFTVYIVPYLDSLGAENFNSKISAKHYNVKANYSSLYEYLTKNF